MDPPTYPFEETSFMNGPLHLKQTFPNIIWIFTEGEGDGIKSRLPFKIFSTLWVYKLPASKNRDSSPVDLQAK